VIDAFGFRQPFVELTRGAPASRSIALDYASFFPVYPELQSFKNGHWHPGVPFVVSLLMKIILAPLAARMLFEQPYDHTKNVSLSQEYALVATLGINDSPDWDLATVIGAASSTKVYGGTYPQWVDGNHTFRSFTFPTLPKGNITQASVAANTSAYFARLDCQMLSNLEDHLGKTLNPQNPTRSATFNLNGTDNDCEWNMNFQVSSGFDTYLFTGVKTDCGDYGGSGSSGRLIIVGGTVESTSKYNLTVVSCVPTYWTASGRLTMDLDPNARSPIKKWSETTAATKELRPGWWPLFEQQLQQVSTVDTTKTLGNADSTTATGRLILDYGRRHFSDPFAVDSLIRSTQEVYATVYAELLNTFMIRQSSIVDHVDADLTTTTNRLFVSNAIAGVILGFLAAVAAILILIFVYTERHHSVLFEEPVGILGYAGLLVDSVVYRMAVTMRDATNFRGKTTENVMGAVEPSRGSIAVFEMAERGDPKRAHIVVQGKLLNDEEALRSFMQAGVGQGVSPATTKNTPEVARNEKHVGMTAPPTERLLPSKRSASPKLVNAQYGK